MWGITIYGSCQFGKQQRASYKAIQGRTTSKVLQLLYIDLMGPIQVERLARKRYVFVCVDEFGNIVRNKIRLVAQSYTQMEGVDFDETFALVAKLEFIHLLFVVACLIDFKLFQMDVKSAFLNGILNEEVYVENPKGFEDPYFPNYAFKLKKAFYGLNQAPRAWY